MTDPKTTTVPVKTRQVLALGKALAPLACALNGHLLRAVLNGRTPVALECTRCPATWRVTRDEPEPAEPAEPSFVDRHIDPDLMGPGE